MSGFHAEDGYTGPSMFGQDGAIVGGVRNKLTYTATEEDKEQARRTVVVIGLRWLLSPGFRGDDYRDAIFPAEVAQWFEEQIGPVKAVHFKPPVQAWVEFKSAADAAAALDLTGATYPRKCKQSPGGRLKVSRATNQELVRGARDHLRTYHVLIPEKFLKGELAARDDGDPNTAPPAVHEDDETETEAEVIAAMRDANPYYDEDMALYEAHHRRELRAEFETRARERADAEAVKRLFRGASTGDVDAVEGAMWAGADADAANPLDGGRTALHYACLAGERAVAQVLVEHGANPSALDGGGSTPADACVSGGKDQRGKIAGDLELARAAHAHMATLAMEINAGRYDVDEPGTSGSMPPLHEAVAARKGALTRFLLAQGASVENTGGSEGDTPLHIAARTGQERMCRLLVLRGAAPDAVAAGGDGATPLHEALRGVKRNGAKGAHAKIAKLFMDEMKRLGRGAEAAAIIADTRA